MYRITLISRANRLTYTLDADGDDVPSWTQLGSDLSIRVDIEGENLPLAVLYLGYVNDKQSLKIIHLLIPLRLQSTEECAGDFYFCRNFNVDQYPLLHNLNDTHLRLAK